MKGYKIFRWLLRASALTTVMFVMQACYGSPYMDKDMPMDPDDREMVSDCDTVASADMQFVE